MDSKRSINGIEEIRTKEWKSGRVEEWKWNGIQQLTRVTTQSPQVQWLVDNNACACLSLILDSLMNVSRNERTI